MQLTTLFLAASGAVLVAAQSSTTTSSAAAGTSSCAAEAVLQACISTEQAQINSCASNDWSCLCQQYGNLLTCYNNCPNDSGVYTVQQEKQQNCAAASAYGTTTLMVATGSATMTSASTTESASQTAVATGFATGSGSVSGSSSSPTATSSSTSGAGHVEMAGGLLAVLAAGFGLFM